MSKELQVKLLTEKMNQTLAAIKPISKTLEDHKKLPIEGNNYAPIKECIREAEETLNTITHDLATTCGPKWADDGDILSLAQAQEIVREITSIQDNLKRLEAQRKECRKKGVAFEANLTAENHTIYSHNKTPITLSITSDATGADGMTYTVQQLEVKGELRLANEDKIKVGTVLNYGEQTLYIDPCGQAGEVKIKLVVSNGKGGESCAGILLDSHKVGLQANLITSGDRMFNHQTDTFQLEIISSEEEKAKQFTYTVKECKIDGGALFFKDGNKLTDGSKVTYGLQDLTFKPNIEKGKASIYLAIENGNGSMATTKKAITIDPITFKVDAAFSETLAADKQKLKDIKEDIKGNYLALDIYLTGVEGALEAGPWKLVSWALKEDPGYKSLKELMPKTSFASLQDAMESIAIENSNETKLTGVLKILEETQKQKTNQFKALGDYKNTLTGRIVSEHKALADVNTKLKSLTDGKTMTLVTINEVAGNEERLTTNKTTLGLKHRHFEKEVELQTKRIERDVDFYQAHALSAQRKTGSVQLALAMKQNMAYAQLFAKGFQEKPTLLDSEFKQLSEYDLKAGTGVCNKFYLKLPAIGTPLILTLTVQGPNNTSKTVEVPLTATIYSMAKGEARRVKGELQDLNAKMDDEIAKEEVSSENYAKLKALNKAIWNNVGDTFLNLRASYGDAWWKNPMFLSLKEVEQMVDEMMAFDRKKQKLDKLRKACKACKTHFEIKAGLHMPELKDGEDPLVGTDKVEYAVLKIKLSKVDPKLKDQNLQPAKWKLLAWQCSDSVPRTIIDKDRVEKYEFELDPNGDNELYLKFPVVELVSEAKITLRIGVAGVTEKEIELDLGPVQNAIAGKHISLFLGELKTLNQEVSAYSSRGVRERDYYTLKKLLKEIRTKDIAYTMMCNAVKEKLNSDPEGLYNMLPGAAAKDLKYLKETEIKTEKENQKALKKELEKWNEVIEACIRFAGTDREAIVDNLYNPDGNGDYLVHKCITHGLDMHNLTFIIEKTKNLNHRNRAGFQPIHLAMSQRNLNIFTTLLDNGASASGDYPGGIPCLVYMVDQISGPYNWVAKWLERGGSPGAWYACRGTDRAHILMRVVISSLGESEKEQLVRKLLDYGAYSYGIGCEGGDWSNTYFNDVDGWNALLAAVERKYKEIARMLLDKGAGSSFAKQPDGKGGTEDVDALDVLATMTSRMNSTSEYENWLSMIKNSSPWK